MGRNLLWLGLLQLSNHPHRLCIDRGNAASVMFEIVQQAPAQIRLAER
jgi:hypothetical protein